MLDAKASVFTGVTDTTACREPTGLAESTGLQCLRGLNTALAPPSRSKESLPDAELSLTRGQ